MIIARLMMTVVWTLLLSVLLHAQQVSVRIQSDSSGCRIGEPIPVNLSVSAPSQWKLATPNPRQGIEGADYVEEGEAEEEAREGLRFIQKPYVITVFDSGTAIVRLQIRYRLPHDTTWHQVSSNALLFNIKGVEVDTAKGHRDITNVLHVGYQWREYLLYGIALLGMIYVLVFGGILFRNLRALPKPESIPTPSPEVHLPAHVIALEKLHHLEEMRLWEKGEDKTFQSLLSGILREYLELRYGLPALELPSAETISALSVHIGAGGSLHLVTRLFTIADMTKFAQYRPTKEQHVECLHLATRFVETTREDGGFNEPLGSLLTAQTTGPGVSP